VTWLRFPRILGVVACLYLVGMSLLFGYLTAESSRFVRDAASTQATVTSLELKAPAGSPREPRARSRNVPLAPRVSYVVNGTAYTYVGAHGRYHERLKVGDTVAVLYDPADPAQARLQGEGRILIPVITAAFAAAALALAVALFLTRHGWPPSRSRPQG